MTFDIFCCKLNTLYPMSLGKGFTGSRRLKNLGFHDGIHFNQEYLYVLDYQEYQPLKKQYQNCPAVLLSCPAEALPLTGNAVAVLDEETDIRTLLQNSAKVFTDFYIWREFLHEFDLSSRDMNSLLFEASEFMEMELWIIDKDYNEGISTRIKKPLEDDPLGLELFTTPELLNQLNVQPEFAKSFNTHGVQPYPSPFLGLLYYFNIFYQEEHIARFLAAFHEQTFSRGRVRMVEYLSEFAERAYIKYHQNTISLRKKVRFKEILSELLLASHTDPVDIQENMGLFGWQPTHLFQVMKLELEEYQGNLISRNYFCAQFDLTFPSCHTLQLHDEIVSVRNLSLEADRQDFDRNFPCFLRENLCHVGISNEAEGAASLHWLWMEAKDALRFGRKKNNTFWYWRFRDYALDYFRFNAVRQYPADHLEHPALAILREYDNRHNSTLLSTLSMFVCQRFSASAAANALFIHRSTFLHRLNRIQELTKLDFSDQEQRVWLMISFFILR